MTETAPTPSSQAQDVGSALRQARLSRGHSIEAVFQRTRIPKKFIEALEANRFDEFPASVYLRGFLKDYCDHLEIDFDSIWERIAPANPKAAPAAETPAVSTKTPAPESAVAVSTRSGPAQSSYPNHPDVPAEPDITDGETHTDSGSMVSWIIFAGVLLVGGFWILRSLPIKPHVPDAPVARLPAPIAPLKAPEPMKLTMVFRREAWVRLHVDGQLRFEGRAPGGYTQGWTASDQFTLRAPKPGDIDLSLDGKPFSLNSISRDASGDYKIVRPQ